MFGLATLWWNLAVPGDGAKGKDSEAKEWDGAIPSALRFEYEKEGSGVKLQRTEIYSDPSAALVAMLKRGC